MYGDLRLAPGWTRGMLRLYTQPVVSMEAITSTNKPMLVLDGNETKDTRPVVPPDQFLFQPQQVSSIRGSFTVTNPYHLDYVPYANNTKLESTLYCDYTPR